MQGVRLPDIDNHRHCAVQGLWKLTVLAFIVLVLAAIFLPRFLKKRQGGADGKKSNGGMQPVLRKSKSKKL